MTRDGLVERNEATGEEQRVSQRGQGFNLRTGQPPRNIPAGSSVRQVIQENTGRIHDRHAQRQPQAQDTAPGFEDAAGVPDGSPRTTDYQPTEAPAPYAQGLESMRQLISAKPDITLEEIKDEMGLTISLAAICKIIKRTLGFRYKKRQYMPVNKTGPTL